MAKEYLMPKLAMAMNEGTINEWLANEGDYIEVGAPLMSVETEKVAYDTESPESGYLHIVAQEGETVPVETLIAQFAESEEELQSLQDSAAPQVAVVESKSPDSTSAPEPAKATIGDRIKASPLARKMANDRGIDLAQLAGSGPGGRIVKRDILAAQEQGVTQAPAAPVGNAKAGEKVRIPFKGMRTTIAKRMVESLQTAAQLSSAWESDVTDLLEVRQSLVAKEEKLGTRVSMNALLIKAVAIAVKQVPIANAALIGDEIVIYDDINVGVAIALPGQSEWDSQLMVPVLKGVQNMSVVEIDLAMKSLIERARNGELGADDMSDSTITLSSTAGIAPPGLKSTPVLNLPNAVLVGPSTPKEQPVVYKGQIVPRTMMPVSVTFDHRILDGEPAARFMNHLHECLENPELLLT